MKYYANSFADVLKIVAGTVVLVGLVGGGWYCMVEHKEIEKRVRLAFSNKKQLSRITDYLEEQKKKTEITLIDSTLETRIPFREIELRGKRFLMLDYCSEAEDVLTYMLREEQCGGKYGCTRYYADKRKDGVLDSVSYEQHGECINCYLDSKMKSPIPEELKQEFEEIKNALKIPKH